MSSYRDDYSTGSRDYFWSLPRVGLAVLAGVVTVFFLLVAVTPLTIGFGWFSGEANLRSFSHVRQTYAFAFDHAEALRGLQSNICIAKSSVSASSATVRDQRLTQLLAVEQTYNRVAREYDAYMEDHFRGKVIRPASLPYPYPPFDLAVC